MILNQEAFRKGLSEWLLTTMEFYIPMFVKIICKKKKLLHLMINRFIVIFNGVMLMFTILNFHLIKNVHNNISKLTLIA